MNVKREVMRLEAISNTPVLSTFTDTIRGLSNIRASRLEGYFQKKFMECQAQKILNKILICGLDGWYNIRSSYLALFLVLIPSYFMVVYYFKNLKASSIIVSIYLVLTLSEDLNEWLWIYSGMESSMISVERCHYFEEIPSEPQYKGIQEDKKHVNGKIDNIAILTKLQEKRKEILVTEGRVDFKDVSCKYATSKKAVLNKLAFSINPGEKIGVIGRTGSGKSTLIKLLWRSLDYYEGDILIDGKSLKSVDLTCLRSQIMIVTQETALIAGTLRENIDLRLSDKSHDARINEILGRLGFEHKEYLADGLDMKIESDGSNLSAGEKQLISFARTLVDKKKVMVLDEATANIDIKTEEKIQKCLEHDFAETTMFIIAHRIQTIMHCSRVLVLDKGNIIEFDSPSTLMSNPSSYFYHIVNKLKE